MDTKRNEESVMEMLKRLALKETGQEVKKEELATSCGISGVFANNEDEEGEEELLDEGGTGKSGVNVLDEPCTLSFHEQNWLLKSGEHAAHLRSQGFKPPHIAVMLGREDLFWWLVNHDEDYVSVTTASNSVFHIAAEYGYFTLVKGIFERFGGAVVPYDKRINEKGTNEAKKTALHLAAAHGHMEIVKYLVEVVKLSVKDRDHESNTPLIVAAQGGHLEVVKWLHSKRGASLADAAQYKYTALLHAAYNGHFSVVKYIMRRGGSNKEVTNLVNTALHVAAMGGHCEIVTYLLEKYPQQFDVSTKNSNGQTPLHLAAWAGHEPLVRLLVTKYASSLTATNAKGNTPFLMACLRGHLSTAQTLIELGSHFTERNRNGNSPLLLAAYGGHNDVIAWLLDPSTHSSLSIHDRSSSGNSALLHACSQALLHTVQYLLEHCGANIADTNNSRRSAFDLASSFRPVLVYLETHRPQPPSPNAVDPQN